jgi:hypothetical protein
MDLDEYLRDNRRRGMQMVIMRRGISDPARGGHLHRAARWRTATAVQRTLPGRLRHWPVDGNLPRDTAGLLTVPDALHRAPVRGPGLSGCLCGAETGIRTAQGLARGRRRTRGGVEERGISLAGPVPAVNGNTRHYQECINRVTRVHLPEDGRGAARRAMTVTLPRCDGSGAHRARRYRAIKRDAGCSHAARRRNPAAPGCRSVPPRRTTARAFPRACHRCSWYVPTVP